MMLGLSYIFLMVRISRIYTNKFEPQMRSFLRQDDKFAGNCGEIRFCRKNPFTKKAPNLGDFLLYNYSIITSSAKAKG